MRSETGMINKSAISIGVMQIIYLFLKSSLVYANVHQNTAQRQGIVDLTAIAFNENISVPLKGPWEFYWTQLLTPADFQKKDYESAKSFIEMPGLWKGKLANGENLNNIGYATYRLRVITPSDDDYFAIYIPKFYSSYKLWINSQLMAESGKVGNNKHGTVHRRISNIVPFKPSKSGTTEIIIQIANFYHKNGGTSEAPDIGHMDVIMKKNKSVVISETMLSTSLILMGLAFLFLYSLWRKDKAVIYFALFCLFWAYRGISDNYAPLLDIIPFLSWEWNAKFEYLALYLGSLMGSLYFNRIFIKKATPGYNAVISGIVLFFALLTLFSPNTLFTYYLRPFFGLMLINLVYITVIVIKSLADKNPASVYAIAGVMLGILVFSSHIFIFNSQNNNLIVYVNVGYLGVFFLSAMLLGVRFSRAFFKLELLQAQTLEQREELKTQADMLKVINDQIVNQKALLEQKNQEIKTINRNLESTVSERTSSLKKINKELDMFLYRASHDLRRPISSIMGIDQIAKLTVKEKEALDLFKKVQNVAQAMEMMLKKFISISEVYNHRIQFTEIELETIKGTFTRQAAFYARVNGVDNYQIDITGPQYIFSDVFIINKITSYLIENSFMFAIPDRNKKLKICIEFKETKQLLSLNFSDNGQGIKKEVIDQIFNMYFIGTVNSNGNGLGLYIVKKAAEKLGEEINVKSEKDKGATFHVVLNKKN